MRSFPDFKTKTDKDYCARMRTERIGGEGLRGSRRRACRAFAATPGRLGGIRQESKREIWMQRGNGAKADQIEFGGQRLGVLLFLSFLALLDDFAEIAGMLAVEGHFQRLRERRIPRVADGHANPRDRLEDGPVPAHREDEYKSNANLGDFSNHCVWTVVADDSLGKGILACRLPRCSLHQTPHQRTR